MRIEWQIRLAWFIAAFFATLTVARLLIKEGVI